MEGAQMAKDGLNDTPCNQGTRRCNGRSWLAGTALTVVLAPAFMGFIPMRTSGGLPLTWGQGSVLRFRSNTVNRNGLPASTIFDIFTRSLNRWKSSAQNGFDFIYNQGTDAAIYPNYTGSLQDNSIFFTSNARSQTEHLGCGTVAVTQVWFNQSSGGAFKADVRFNDNCFTFTNTPTDTVTQSRIYLPDVATHEFGHALGLDHSQNLQSSMIYTAAVQQAFPSCDDHAAMASMYGAGALASRTGTLEGRVLAPDGSAVFGAFVEAISVERGKSMASAMSLPDGRYSISGLEPGTYNIMISPFYPGANSLARYYSSINSNVCGGAPFARTIARDGGSLLRAVAVGAGSRVDFGAVTVDCSGITSAYAGAERTLESAPTIAAGGPVSSFSLAGAFGSESTHYYLLRGVSGFVAVHAASYSLFSPVDVAVDLLGSNGQRISGQGDVDNVFSTVSGYVNYDGQTYANLGSSAQDVIVRVTRRGTVPYRQYPSGTVGLDTRPFYVLALSSGVRSSTAVYALNARCEAADAFGTYTSPAEPGPVPTDGGGSSGNGGSGGCGMIRSAASGIDHGDGGHFSSPGGMARLGNFVLFFVMISMGVSALRRPRAITVRR
jgi:predicted Zn-dependent protease